MPVNLASATRAGAEKMDKGVPLLASKFQHVRYWHLADNTHRLSHVGF